MLDQTSQFRPTLTTLNERDGDSAVPRQIVTVYFVHTIQNPFCLNPLCECHQNQEQIAEHFDAIETGQMILKNAAEFR